MTDAQKQPDSSAGRRALSGLFRLPPDVLAAMNKTDCQTLEQLRRDPVRDEVRGAGAPLGLMGCC